MDAQAQEIKNKVICEINSFAIVYFFFDDRLLIKQQTAWSQGSSKYQKQKKCTRSEISINLSFYVYIIPKRNNYSSNSNKKKGKWLQSENWPLKIYIRIISIIPISVVSKSGNPGPVS